MGRLGWAVIGVWGLCIFGCSANDITMKRQAETEARLEQMVQRTTADGARLAEMGDELKDVRKMLAASAAALEELRSRSKESISTLEMLEQRVADLTSPKVSKIEVVNREPAADKDGGAQQEVYLKAFGLFSANSYDAAISAFDTYIKTYPQGEYAGNAQYWIGECYYTQRSYREALDAFNRVLSDYPKGGKVPDAMLKIGYTLASLNETDKGNATLQELVRKFPKSQAAEKARERLNRH